MLLSFGDCVLDMERRELRRHGVAVHTRAKVFNILSYLIVNRDRILSSDEVLAHGWPGLTVSDATLRSCIRSVRRAIGDNGSNPRFLITLRGQGFRFIAEVRTQDASGREIPAAAPATHARDDSLSIAILPFNNLNDDRKLDYLADGLAEDITTELSRFKAFTVIARNSAFQYRGPNYDLEKIGAELRVDYIVEGSVRCAGKAFRATAQLVYVPTRNPLWAEKFDGQVDALFTLQEDISRKVATNIMPEVEMAEIRRAAIAQGGDSRAQEMAWRARALLDRSRSETRPELYDQGMELAEAAVALDPQCRQAWWMVSFANYLRAFGRQGGDAEVLLARAREAAEQLRAFDRNDHCAYMSLGWISFIERDMKHAASNLDHAHKLNPNCAMTLMLMGVIATSSGNPQTGYAHLCRAVRLSPRDLWLGFMRAGQGFACYAMERFEDGAAYARQAIDRDPNAPANHIILAACLVETGDLDDAAAAIRAQRRINEKYLQENLDRKWPSFQDPKLAERYAAALCRAAKAAG